MLKTTRVLPMIWFLRPHMQRRFTTCLTRPGTYGVHSLRVLSQAVSQEISIVIFLIQLVDFIRYTYKFIVGTIFSVTDTASRPTLFVRRRKGLDGGDLNFRFSARGAVYICLLYAQLDLFVILQGRSLKVQVCHIQVSKLC